MSVSQIPARLAVHTVDDLVGLVPYLIGFHPQDSLVVIVQQRGRVEVTARADIADVASPEDAAHLVGKLFARFPLAEAWFLAYSHDEALAWDVLCSCALLAGVGRVARVVHVGPERWRADAPDGLSGTLGVTAAAAEAVVNGLPVRASRADLEAMVAGPADDEVDGLCELFERIASEVDELGERGRRRLVQRLMRRGGERARADWVRLAVLVADPATVVELVSGLRVAQTGHLVALWTQVVRHCLVPYLPAPLGLVGVTAWLAGNGAMASVCLQRIERLDPHHPMATLLDGIISDVLPPTEWPRRRVELVARLAAAFSDSA